MWNVYVMIKWAAMRFQNDIILRLADGIPAGKEGANAIYSSLDADYLAKSPPSWLAL